MSEELRNSLWRITEKLVSLAAADEQVRRDLHVLAQAVAVLTMPQPPALPTDVSAVEAVAVAVPSVQEVAAPPVAPHAPTPAPQLAEFTKALTFASARRPETSVKTAAPEIELAAIERRCRLKAEAARWAAQRQRRMAEGASFEDEIQPKDSEIIQKGKEAGTFLWMNNPAGPCSADPRLLEDVASGFDATGSAITLVRSVMNESQPDNDDFTEALMLLAEAQCMLRTAVDASGGTDREQASVYEWLRRETYQRQVFIPKFMRLADTADPNGVADLSKRIDELDGRLEKHRSLVKKRQSEFGKLRYHQKLIINGGDSAYNWPRIFSAVGELVAMGVPPSSIDLRAGVLPIIDSLPDEEPPESFKLVLREVDRFLASQPQQEPVPVRPDSEDVRAVAKLLDGKTVTLVGGNERPAASKAIKEAFGLKALIWVRSEEHESVSSFEPAVAGPEVALVILMIRWSSHSYGDLQKYCDKYGKPLVRLPGGYNPNQVAYQIQQQVSEKLKKR
jgi:hypothetical protein